MKTVNVNITDDVKVSLNKNIVVEAVQIIKRRKRSAFFGFGIIEQGKDNLNNILEGIEKGYYNGNKYHYIEFDKKINDEIQEILNKYSDNIEDDYNKVLCFITYMKDKINNKKNPDWLEDFIKLYNITDYRVIGKLKNIALDCGINDDFTQCKLFSNIIEYNKEYKNLK